MRSKKQKAKYPGKILGDRSSLTGSVYSHFPLVPDPRQINRIVFLRCSTIKLHGTYLGTDKLSHFVAMGYLYYGKYRTGIRERRRR